MLGDCQHDLVHTHPPRPCPGKQPKLSTFSARAKSSLSSSSCTPNSRRARSRPLRISTFLGARLRRPASYGCPRVALPAWSFRPQFLSELLHPVFEGVTVLIRPSVFSILVTLRASRLPRPASRWACWAFMTQTLQANPRPQQDENKETDQAIPGGLGPKWQKR